MKTRKYKKRYKPTTQFFEKTFSGSEVLGHMFDPSKVYRFLIEVNLITSEIQEFKLEEIDTTISFPLIYSGKLEQHPNLWEKLMGFFKKKNWIDR